MTQKLVYTLHSKSPHSSRVKIGKVLKCRHFLFSKNDVYSIDQSTRTKQTTSYLLKSGEFIHNITTINDLNSAPNSLLNLALKKLRSTHPNPSENKTLKFPKNPNSKNPFTLPSFFFIVSYRKFRSTPTAFCPFFLSHLRSTQFVFVDASLGVCG